MSPGALVTKYRKLRCIEKLSIGEVVRYTTSVVLEIRTRLNGKLSGAYGVVK